MNTLLKFDPKNTVLIAQKQKLLSAAVVDTKDKLEALRETQRKIDDGSIEATEEQYRDLEREIASTEAKLQKLTAEQERFSSVAAVQMQAVGRELQQIGQKMTEAGKALLPLTVAITAIGAASLKASIEFESSFAGVKKTVDATADELDRLAESARQAALVKPVDVNDINRIMELGGQLGVATDQLDKFASVIGDLDVATDMNVEDASTNLAQFMNICGTATGDIDRLGSTIVALGNSSATTESAIVDMAMRLAGTASASNMTESEIMGLAAALSSVGIAAESGGTALSQIIARIDKDVAMGGESLETWAATARMSSQEFKDAWETDAAGALTSLIGGMQQAVESGGNINLILDEMGITAIRQTDTLKRMTNAADLMAGSINTASTAWESNVALTNEAAQRYQTTESKLIMFKNQIIDIGISIGNGLKGALVGLMSGAQPLLAVISSVASAFEHASPPLQALITGAIGLAAGIGPLLIITGKLTSGLGSLIEGMGKAAAAMVAKTSATAADTATTSANTAAKTANTAALNLNIIKTALKEATDARMAAKTAAATAATSANTAATVANTAATTAGGTAAGAAAIKTVALSVAANAKTIAATAATAAQLAWNAAMAANPIGAVVLAVTALVSVIGFAISAMSSMTKEQETLTASSERQRQKVEELQLAYDEAVAAQGEHSDAAIKAKAALDQETQAFEATKETMEQFKARCEETIASHEELTSSIAESTGEAEAEAGKILYLSEKISTLSAIENKSAQDKEELVAMTQTLNSACEGLNLTYDAQTDSLNMSIEALNSMAEAEADRLRSAVAMESYSSLIEEQVQLEMQLAEANDNRAEQSKKVTEQYKENGEAASDLSASTIELAQTVEDTRAALEENEAAQRRALETAAKYSTKQSILARALQEVEDGTLTAEEAARKYTDAVEGGITADEIRAEQALQAALAEQELAQATNDAATAMQDYAYEHPSFQAALDASGLTISEFSEILADQGVKFDDAASAIENYSSRAASGFDKVADSSKNTLDSLYETLSYNLKATENWSKNLEAVFGRTGVSFSTEFIDAVREGGVEEYGTVMAQLADASDKELQKVSDAFARNGQAGVESYLAEQRLLVPGTKEALDGAGEAVEQALQEGKDAAATSGSETGTAYSENLKAVIATCPEEVQSYIKDLEDELASAEGAAGAAGTNTGSSYTSNLSNAIASCPGEVQTYISQLEEKLQAMQSEAGEIGEATGSEYSSKTASGMTIGSSLVSQAASMLNASVKSKLSSMPAYGSTTGTNTGKKFASGLSGSAPAVSSASGIVKNAAMEKLQNVNGTSYGQKAGNTFASGISSTSGKARSAAKEIASQCERWSELSSESRTWGNHAGSEFANGLRASVSIVRSAATSIAGAVRSILHFTVPDEGPLADADEYGPDFMELLASGIYSKMGDVRKAAMQVANEVRDGLSQELQVPMSVAWLSNLMDLPDSSPHPSRVLSALSSYGYGLASNQSTTTTNGVVNNFYGNITLSANDVKDVQTFDDFAKRLQHEMRQL